MTDQEALAGASQLARNAVNAARFFDPSLWILTPPTGWLNRIDEVLRYHGAADRDGSPLGVALGNLIKSWYKDPAEEAPGPVHWGPRGEPVVDGELKDRFAAAYEKLDPHNDDNFYRQTGEAAFAVVAPVLAERDREAEQVRIRLADALEMTYSLTVAELIDAVSEYVTEFQNLARRKAKAAETYRLDADTHRQQIERLTRERDEAQAAIRDIDAHATPIGLLHEDDPDGSPHHYLVSVGALHRALGKSNGTGVKCDVERNLLRWLHAEAMWQLGEAGEVVGQQRAELDEHRFKLNDALGIVGAEEDIDPYEAVVGLHREIDRLRAERDEAREHVADLVLEVNRSWTGWDNEVPAAVEEARQEVERLRAELGERPTRDAYERACEALERRRIALVHAIGAHAGASFYDCVDFIRDAHTAGRFDEFPGRPDTEATEQAPDLVDTIVQRAIARCADMDNVTVDTCSADQLDRYRDYVTATLGELPMHVLGQLGQVQDSSKINRNLEQAPREPRRFGKYDDEPQDGRLLRSTLYPRHVFARTDDGWGCTVCPDVAHTNGPLTWNSLQHFYGPMDTEVTEDGPSVGTPDAETRSGP